MEYFQEGDIVTLRVDAQSYFAVKIVEIEPLTLHDLVHLKVYDVKLEGLPGGYDATGEYQNRLHELPADLSSSSLAIDTLALTSSAFEESDPLAVAREDVTDADRSGYAVWVAQRRESAERRGMIRYDVDDEEEWEDIDADEEPSQDHDDDVIDESEDQAEDYETVEVVIRPWHSRVYDIPFSSILREHRGILVSEDLGLGDLASYLREKMESGKQQIDVLITSLVDEGDYAAGQELLEFGDDALPGLVARLNENTELQGVEDICQILADLGTDAAYQELGTYVESTLEKLGESDAARAGARSFLYAVMLTGGTSPALKERLHLIDRMEHPELTDDLESALSAIAQGVITLKSKKRALSRPIPLGR